MSPIDERRRRARRTAFALAVLAIAIYGLFIFMSVRRSHG